MKENKPNSDRQTQETTVDLSKARIIKNTSPYVRYLAQPRGYIHGVTGERMEFAPEDTFFCTESGINLLFTGTKIIFLFPFKIYSPGMTADLTDYLKQLASAFYKTGYLGIETLRDITNFSENKWKRIAQLYPMLNEAYDYFINRNVTLFKWKDVQKYMLDGDLDYRFICDELESVQTTDPQDQPLSRWTVAQDETNLKVMHDFFQNDDTAKTIEDYRDLMKHLHLTNNYKKWCIREQDEAIQK